MSEFKLTNELKLTEKITETDDACSFVFEIKDELKEKFKYSPGQFVSLVLNINGEEVTRSYSLSSCPNVDTQFKITIKKVKGGKASNYLLDNVQVGDMISLTPPAGLFYRPPKEESQGNYIFLVGGSGITPAISILKHVLNSPQENNVNLLYANRNEESIIFYEALNDLEKKYEGRLNILHSLSQPSAAWSGPSGRLNKGTVEEFLKTCQLEKFSKNDFFLCGPEGLMEIGVQTLESMNISKENIHRESFVTATPTTSATTPEEDDDGVFIGDSNAKSDETPRMIEVVVDGETHELEFNENMSILETLLEADLNPPFSCMNGACMACMCKIKEGIVHQEDPGVLADDNIEAGEFLSCQAKVRSKKVKIDYDEI